MNDESAFSRFFLIFSLGLFLLMAIGCSPDASNNEAMDGMDENTHEEHEADTDHDANQRQFVPNDGAEVHVVSPADGASFKSNDTIPIMIETTNFNIGEDGNHWHIYLDGKPIMVTGGETYVLQNLEPGHHEIDVYLSLGSHEDLQEGDKIMIMVE